MLDRVKKKKHIQPTDKKSFAQKIHEKFTPTEEGQTFQNVLLKSMLQWNIISSFHTHN